MADAQSDDETPDALHLAFALAQHHVALDELPEGELDRMLAEMRDAGSVETSDP